jgi:hypothetical protein
LSDEGRSSVNMTVAEVRSLVDAIQRKHASGSANKTAAQPVPTSPPISDQEAAPEELETASIQSIKAALMNPVKSLRTE